MRLKIMLPARIFIQETGVKRIVSESHNGSFGILPKRLDCLASLVPGILTYETKDGVEKFVAVDEGVLVKNGPEVLVSVRRAIGGVPLEQLRSLVKTEFLTLDQQENELQLALHKLESGFMKQFSDLNKT